MFTSILKAPELAEIPEQHRLAVVRFSRLSGTTAVAQAVEALLFVSICADVIASFVFGYFHGGFWVMMGIMAVSLFSVLLAFAPIFVVIGRRRLRRFLCTQECQRLLRVLNEKQSG